MTVLPRPVATISPTTPARRPPPVSSTISTRRVRRATCSEGDAGQLTANAACSVCRTDWRSAPRRLRGSRSACLGYRTSDRCRSRRRSRACRESPLGTRGGDEHAHGRRVSPGPARAGTPAAVRVAVSTRAMVRVGVEPQGAGGLVQPVLGAVGRRAVPRRTTTRRPGRTAEPPPRGERVRALAVVVRAVPVDQRGTPVVPPVGRRLSVGRVDAVG
jgi:hypothetical protein